MCSFKIATILWGILVYFLYVDTWGKDRHCSQLAYYSILDNIDYVQFKNNKPQKQMTAFTSFGFCKQLISNLAQTIVPSKVWANWHLSYHFFRICSDKHTQGLGETMVQMWHGCMNYITGHLPRGDSSHSPTSFTCQTTAGHLLQRCGCHHGQDHAN